jgi:hypothetical protein
MKPSRNGPKGSTTTRASSREALVYYDDEALYFELRGKDSGIVRFSYEMLETLKVVVEEQD